MTTQLELPMAEANIYGEITADGTRIVLIIEGNDFASVRAAKMMQTLTPKLSATEPRGAIQIPLSWPAVVQLAALYGKHWRPMARLTAWITDEINHRVALPPLEPVTNAAGLTPYPYQLDAAAMIAATGRCLLFDDPGTGKTASTILGLVQRDQADFGVFPVLVICPASVVDPWIDQWRMWASPEIGTAAWRGTPAQRRELLGTADVYVASYETARIDTLGGERPSAKYNPLLQLKLCSVVADEIHQIKNHTTKRSRAVRKLAAQANQFIGLSGTPITHSPADLWPTLEALAPGAWPSRERWVNRYCRTLPSEYGAPEILGLNENEPEFRRTLLGQHRRVAKADVLTQLPPKVYSVRTVELPPEYRQAYDRMEAEMIAELPDNDDELTVMGVLAQMARLSQLASAAADVEVTVEIVEDPVTHLPVEKQHQKVTLKFPSWKVDALMEVLDERPGRPVIATAPSRQLIELAGREATFRGYKVGYVVGGQKPAERTAAITDFQAGKLDLICVTTGAGGVGITLTAADTLVFLQRPWSLVESIQMEDRAHRIGSEVHESIEIIDIVAKGTIDSRVRAVLRERAGQLSDLVQDKRILTELLGGSDMKRKKAA